MEKANAVPIARAKEDQRHKIVCNIKNENSLRKNGSKRRGLKWGRGRGKVWCEAKQLLTAVDKFVDSVWRG